MSTADNTDFIALEAMGLSGNVKPYQPETIPAPETVPPVGAAQPGAEKFKIYVKSIKELDAMEFKNPEYIIYPWLRVGESAFISAKPGIGKTFLAMTVAKTITGGGTMFADKWGSDTPRRVLYVDGEMRVADMDRRRRDLGIYNDNFYLVNPDLFPLEAQGINFAYMEWQESLIQKVEEIGAELVIFDNLSSLYRVDKTNSSESWQAMQDLILRLRKMGVASIVVDHEGKGAEGSPRGTSAKGDIAYTMITLRRPDDYSPEDAARFEVHFTKARGFHGEEAKPFEVRLIKDNSGGMVWDVSDIVESENKGGRPVDQEKRDEIEQLYQQGKGAKEIIQITGYSSATVYRIFNKLKEENSVIK